MSKEEIRDWKCLEERTRNLFKSNYSDISGDEVMCDRIAYGVSSFFKTIDKKDPKTIQNIDLGNYIYWKVKMMEIEKYGKPLPKDFDPSVSIISIEMAREYGITFPVSTRISGKTLNRKSL